MLVLLEQLNGFHNPSMGNAAALPRVVPPLMKNAKAPPKAFKGLREGFANFYLVSKA